MPIVRKAALTTSIGTAVGLAMGNAGASPMSYLRGLSANIQDVRCGDAYSNPCSQPGHPYPLPYSKSLGGFHPYPI